MTVKLKKPVGWQLCRFLILTLAKTFLFWVYHLPPYVGALLHAYRICLQSNDYKNQVTQRALMTRKYCMEGGSLAVDLFIKFGLVLGRWSLLGQVGIPAKIPSLVVQDSHCIL